MTNREVDLYALLPSVYRAHDAENGYALKGLLDIVATQVDLVKRDIDGLYADMFVETAAEWAVSYIGDLVGNNPIHPVAQRARVDVAKTVHYRRRKGTLSLLETLARDVTGWGARVVPFFEYLGWTQNLNHLRVSPAPNPTGRNAAVAERVGTVNVRDRDALDRLGGPFDVTSHTVDVRPIGQGEGLHNIKNVGFFLWRLRSYPLEGVRPRRSRAYKDGFHFNPLGHPTPLFTHAEAGGASSGAGLVGEADVPGPVRPLAFASDPSRYYGHGNSFAIYRGPRVDPDQLIPVTDLVPRSLEAWERPPPGKVYVDVCRGRFAFAEGEAPPERLTVSYCYGFSGDVGGGPYDRSAELEDPDSDTWFVVVSKESPAPAPDVWRTTIQQAVASWDPTERSRLVVEIRDNVNYGQNLDMAIPPGCHVEIRAGDGYRPLLRPGVNVDVTGGARSSFAMQGVVLDRGALVFRGELETVTLTDCTFVPGRGRLEDGSPRYPAAYSIRSYPAVAQREIRIKRCITGRIEAPPELHTLHVSDSIIDAPAGKAGIAARRVALAGDRTGARPGPATTLEGVTVFGSVNVTELTLASEVLFESGVTAERRQQGCVRFSYVSPGSATPRRHRSEPDLALEALAEEAAPRAPAGDDVLQVLATLRPTFSSMNYGDPDYAQLSRNAAEELRTGAEDGSEMGAFMHLKQPQREANLRLRLKEYLPFGLEPGIIYVT